MSMSSDSFPRSDRFELLKELGAGGMGVVYAVFDRARGERLALKTLRKRDPNALLRLKNEFRALQDLQHPNLVALNELFCERDQWFFTMELVHGVDLISYVRTGPAPAIRRLRSSTGDTWGGAWSERAGSLAVAPALSPVVLDEAAFDERKLRDCLAQLAEGLAALHASGRVHRDIKPGNILVEPEGRLVLLDLGLVAQADSSHRSGEHVYPVGTAAYMAPEQALGKAPSPAADWYSVGVVLFEAITGQLPFDGPVMLVLAEKQMDDAPRTRDRVAGVPEDLDDLCAALLQREPDRRPGAEQVLEVARRAAGRGGHVRGAGLVVAPSRIFVGRRAELAAMLRAWESVAAGGGRALLLHGYSGLGKSELLRAFMRAVLERNPETVVLPSRCYERELAPYKAFDGMVDALCDWLGAGSAAAVAELVPANAALLLRLFPVLGRLDAFRDAPQPASAVADLQEVRNLAFLALRELLIRLAERQPVAVVIDDLQWVDEDSKRLLRVLLEPPGAPRLLLLAALRTSGDGEEALREVEAVVDLFPERPEVVALGPLSAEESAELVEALAPDYAGGGSEAGKQLAQIAREGGGHPMFIRELAQHAMNADAGTAPRGTGVLRLDDALWCRVQELDAPARKLMELVAVAASPLPQRTIAAAAGLGGAEMFRLAGRLRTQRLLRTGGPDMNDEVDVYHDRVREAVIAKTAGEVLCELHGRLADVMLASGDAEAERLAYHLESANRGREAAVFAAKAGERAAEALAFKRAAELFRKALANWPEPTSAEQAEALRKLQIQLGEALANAGRGMESADAYRLAVVGATPAQAIELKRRAAEQMLRSGHVEPGLTAVHEVLTAIGMKLPRTTLGAMVALLWQRLKLRLRGLRFRVREVGEIPQEALVRADVCNAVSQGLAMIDTIRGAYFSTMYVRRALDVGERTRVLRALWMEANYAANTGLPEKYVARLHQAMASLIGDDAPLARAYLDSARGFASFMDGRWKEALRLFEASERVFTAGGGNVWERTTFRFFILWSLYYLGELGEISRRVMPLHADAVDRGDRYAASGMLLGLANVAFLNAYGPAEARRLVDEATREWSGKRYYLWDYHALLARTQIDLYDDDGESAYARVVGSWRSLRRSLLLMIPTIRVEAHHLRARAALARAARCASAERDALLADASRHTKKLHNEKSSWARALALPLSAAIAMQRRRPGEAVRLLREGMQALEQHDMRLVAAVARHRLGAILGGDEGVGLMAEAARYFGDQQIKAPAQMVAMLAPGFEPGR